MRSALVATAMIVASIPATVTAQQIHREPVQCRTALEPYTGAPDKHGAGGYWLIARFLIPQMTYPAGVDLEGELHKPDGSVAQKIMNVPPQPAWKPGSWVRFAGLRYAKDPRLTCRATLRWAVKGGGKSASRVGVDTMGPVARIERIVPALPRPLGTANGIRVDTIDGRREAIMFKRGTLHRIDGKGLSGGTAAWLIGPDDGGSVLTIRNESDTRLLVEVSDIAGANTPWPAGRTRANARPLKIRIEAGYGQRVLEFDLPRSVYACRAGEPNCGK